jgi:glutamyl-tRNA synthetase
MTIRTRFAPSPTGYLHIGSARTALYSWLYARKYQGVFILRIEDTDLERSTPESVQAILDAMHWLGLNYDEGPFYQTQRFERYREVINQLLDSGKAYRCYCTKERLETLRADQLANKQKPRYDGYCRHQQPADSQQPYVIRFLNPTEGEVLVEDKVHGVVNFKNSELDDLIIARSDGSPTYNFTVVVDDWDMQITHVIRGDDHLNNTPRQINMLQALGAPIPTYAHIPMILGSEGKRLSKRHGAVGVMQYCDEGYLPQAMLNYLVRLGWSNGDQEIFSLDEMIKLFDIDRLNNAPAALNPEKMLWLNHHYIKTSKAADLIPHLTWQMDNLAIPYQQGPDLADLIAVQAERCKTLREMAENSRYFYSHVISYSQEFSHHFTADVLSALRDLLEQFKLLETWSDESLHNLLLAVAEKFKLKLGKIAQPLRIAVSGGTISPPINSTLRLLGKLTVCERLAKALEYYK